MKILGIESSCDETAAAVAEKTGNRVEILSSRISSQIDIHRKYGGVVPEVAARQHISNILPVINEALLEAGLKKDQPEIDAIAVTGGPGLITSLIVGIETAKALALAWNKPLVCVNHIEGHIYANFIGQTEIKFPSLILTVSGGHTALALMEEHGILKTIGETRDDAAGEAFDKAAKLMEAGYPGGPAIAKLAEKGKAGRIKLPRPMLNSGDYDFSFSGLKTALLYEIKNDPEWKGKAADYAAEFQQAVTDVLVSKTIKAARDTNAKTVLLAGGVAANFELRKQLSDTVREKLPQAKFIMPELGYTTDNAAMIAAAGCFKAETGAFTPLEKAGADCNFKL